MCFMAMSVHTVAKRVLSPCSFSYQRFEGTLQFDQGVACLPETLLIYLEYFSS
jgi:hypothetical protein